jgi:ribosome-binding factor A
MKERVKRVSHLIRNELSKIILKEIEFEKDVFVTLTRVETLKDLSECKVFISVMPEEKSIEVFKNLNSQIYFLQKRLNSILKMRKVPKIVFLPEEKLIEAERIEKILVNLKKEKK